MAFRLCGAIVLLFLSVGLQGISAGCPTKGSGGNPTSCPVSDPAFSSPDGAIGAILTQPGDLYRRHNTKSGSKGQAWTNTTVSVMLQYDKRNAPTARDCYLKCQNYPTSTPSAYNEALGGCAYYSYDTSTGDCYLFDCSACTDSSSYSKKGQFKKYVSGDGPAGCGGGGSVGGDPHFTGGDGSHFDFTGIPNKNYCLVSDSHLHINAYFGGRRGTWLRRSKVFNWIRQVGILWGHHNIRFSVREGASWQYENGYLGSIEVDGEKVVVAQPGDVVSLADGQIQVEWLAAREMSGDDLIDIYAIRIPGVMEMDLRLRPEVAALRTPKDGTVHIDITFASLYISTAVHGVLGQTYRRDHLDRLSKQKLVHSEVLNVDVVPGDDGEGFLDASPRAYIATDLLKADCQVARFARFDTLDLETSQAIEAGSGSAVSTLSLLTKALRRRFSRKL